MQILRRQISCVNVTHDRRLLQKWKRYAYWIVKERVFVRNIMISLIKHLEISWLWRKSCIIRPRIQMLGQKVCITTRGRTNSALYLADIILVENILSVYRSGSDVTIHAIGASSEVINRKKYGKYTKCFSALEWDFTATSIGRDLQRY